MFVACIVVSVMLAAVLLLSAVGKIRRDPRQMVTMLKVGFPEDKLWLLALAEAAGAVGLVVGLYWWPLGVAAALGVIGYFIGALVSHLRVKDTAIAAPAALLTVAGVAMVFRLVSA
jgi:hypothetical protein